MIYAFTFAVSIIFISNICKVLGQRHFKSDGQCQLGYVGLRFHNYLKQLIWKKVVSYTHADLYCVTATKNASKSSSGEVVYCM